MRAYVKDLRQSRADQLRPDEIGAPRLLVFACDINNTGKQEMDADVD